MIIDWSAIVTVGIQVLALVFILGKHKAILDKHEKAIQRILDRLDTMNSEIGYIKG